MAIAGTAAGLVVAFRLAPLLASVLYGVTATEKSIFLACVIVLITVAVVASIIPARCAAKLDPMTCLRHE